MTIKDPEYTTQKTKTPNNTNSIEYMGWTQVQHLLSLLLEIYYYLLPLINIMSYVS
jgi:hypothetical protein